MCWLYAFLMIYAFKIIHEVTNTRTHIKSQSIGINSQIWNLIFFYNILLLYWCAFRYHIFQTSSVCSGFDFISSHSYLWYCSAKWFIILKMMKVLGMSNTFWLLKNEKNIFKVLIERLNYVFDFSRFKYNQIEKFVMMNVEGVITNQICNNLFKEFLRIGHRSDKNNTLFLIECFEMVDQMLRNPETSESHLENLIEMCPSFLWEQRLKDVLNAENFEKVLLNNVLVALKIDCLCNIEADSDFIRFKEKLLEEIDKKWFSDLH